MDNNNMNTIKFLKENKIRLNGVNYKPYSICNIPDSFGFKYSKERDTRGIGEWFNFRGLTYVKE